MPKTIAIDFDGVIHSYKSGWQGPTTIQDPPVPGITEALATIRENGYHIVIYSTRAKTKAGREAIKEWLKTYEIDWCIDEITAMKPIAEVYIDDRAICFDGNASNLPYLVETFAPWDKKEVVFHRNFIAEMHAQDYLEAKMTLDMMFEEVENRYKEGPMDIIIPRF